MTNHLLLRCSILIAAAFLFLGLATRTHAQTASPVTLLDDAYATLAQAKHDYKGHRVKAMKQIELALGEKGAKVGGKGKVRCAAPRRAGTPSGSRTTANWQSPQACEGRHYPDYNRAVHQVSANAEASTSC